MWVFYMRTGRCSEWEHVGVLKINTYILLHNACIDYRKLNRCSDHHTLTPQTPCITLSERLNGVLSWDSEHQCSWCTLVQPWVIDRLLLCMYFHFIHVLFISHKMYVLFCLPSSIMFFCILSQQCLGPYALLWQDEQSNAKYMSIASLLVSGTK